MLHELIRVVTGPDHARVSSHGILSLWDVPITLCKCLGGVG